MGINSNTYKNRGKNRFGAFGKNRGKNRGRNRGKNRFGPISNHKNLFLLLFLLLFFEEIEGRPPAALQRGQRPSAAGPFGSLFLQIIGVQIGVKIGFGG